VAEPTSREGLRRRQLPHGLLLALGVVATGLILLLTIGVVRPDEVGGAGVAPATTAAPPPVVVAPKPVSVAPEDHPDASDVAELDKWARRLAKPTGLPATLLAAYGRAEMWMRTERPGCHLSWPTLAAIGQVQAVGSGPLPVSEPLWRGFAGRASSDGKPPDPRDVDDAAFTAARALCAGGQDLLTGPGWWTAVLGYTQSAADAHDVLTAATTYAAVPA
jgi:membrane-bound lytic murein transglycosylase B